MVDRSLYEYNKGRLWRNRGGGNNGTYGTFTPTTSSFTETNLGFMPTRIAVWINYGSSNIILDYDVINSKVYQFYGGNRSDQTSAFLNTAMYVSDNKFYYKAIGSGYVTLTYYMAIKDQ